MATIDQQFVEYIVKTLVNNPEKVAVERKIDEKGVLLSLSVDPEDVGRVIGKRGATAQSIRTLLRALGTKNDARYNLKIVNTDAPEGTERSAHEISRSSNSEEGTSPEGDDAEISGSRSETENENYTRSEELADKTRAEMADLDDLDI